MSETDGRLPPVRLIVARCEVTYTGRLNAFLPESTRLLMLKADGSVLVHADAGGYKPLELDDAADRDRGRRRRWSSSASAPAQPRTGSRSGCIEVLSDVEHEMGEAAALEKDGVERDLQLAARRRAHAHRATACGSSGANGRPTSAPST